LPFGLLAHTYFVHTYCTPEKVLLDVENRWLTGLAREKAWYVTVDKSISVGCFVDGKERTNEYVFPDRPGGHHTAQGRMMAMARHHVAMGRKM